MADQHDGETIDCDVEHIRGCDDAAICKRNLEGPCHWTFVAYWGALHDKNVGGAGVGDSMFCWELENATGDFLSKEVLEGACTIRCCCRRTLRQV